MESCQNAINVPQLAVGLMSHVPPVQIVRIG